MSPKHLLPFLAFLGWAIASPSKALDVPLESDAHGLGMGGAVAAVSGGTHAVAWNPAGIARAQVPMLQFGSSFRPDPSAFGLDATGLYPTRDHTVFAISGFSSRIRDASDTVVAMLSAGVPLNDSRDLLFGANLKHFTLRDRSGDLPLRGRGIGLDLGLSYDLHLPSGAEVLSFALAVHDANTQVRFDRAGEQTVTRRFVAGLAYQRPSLRFEVDYEAVDRVLSESRLHDRLKAGVERFLADRNFSVRAGYDDLLNSGGHFTGGFGYHPDRPFELIYATAFSEKDRDLSHHASLVLRFDRWFPTRSATVPGTEIDLGRGTPATPEPTRSPGRPVAGVPLKKRPLTLSPPAFSPNGDGRHDAVTVTLPALRPGEIEQWELTFTDRDGRIRRRASGRDPLPPSWIWNGLDDAGQSCPDGTYRVLLKTWGAEQTLLSEDDRTVDLMTQTTRFGIVPSTRAFSPTRGRGVLFQVRSPETETVGSWEFEVSDSGTNRVVYATQGRGRLPKRISWNGRDAKGVPVPDGSYVCLLVAEDRAGNRMQGDAVRVSADSQPPELQLKVADPWWDPARSAAIRIGLESADRNALTDWRLVLQDDEGRERRVFSGRGEPPREVVWDAKDAKGSPLDPGSFVTLRLTGSDEAGNMGAAEPLGLQIAFVPPEGAQLTLNLTTVTFQKGSAELSADAVRELAQAAQAIRPYLEKSVVVLKGFSTEDEAGSGLALSRRRATAARKALAEVLGVPEGRLVAMALGSREPLQTASGLAAPDRQRRVVVTLFAQK